MAVIIPSLHPSRDLLGPFVECVYGRGFGQVIVVDDGSGADYRNVFDDLESRLGCVVLRHDVNQGKGTALKTAFAYCQEHADRFDAVVTADSDGQHTVEDVSRVAARTLDLIALHHPAVVLGVRTFDDAHVPSKSRLGNRATSAVVRVFFGRQLDDTQTGLRGFPLDTATRSAHVAGERFDYEMNVLLWLLSTRTAIDEVPIETIYHDLSNSVSHFRPVVDSTRVYAVILRQLVKFSGVSIASAVLDIALYVALLETAFSDDQLPERIAAAVVIARVVSSLFNYSMNKWLVFHDDSRRVTSLLRYASLASVILLASASGSTALTVISGGHAVLAKLVVDGTLFVASYLVQERWVFRDRSLERT